MLEITGVFISTNGNVVKATFDGLKDMQRAVGGLIQPVDLEIAGHQCTLFIDEEGRCIHEDYQIPNQLATDLTIQPIIGDAFLIGGVDNQGRSLSLHPEARDAVLEGTAIFTY